MSLFPRRHRRWSSVSSATHGHPRRAGWKRQQQQQKKNCAQCSAPSSMVAEVRLRVPALVWPPPNHARLLKSVQRSRKIERWKERKEGGKKRRKEKTRAPTYLLKRLKRARWCAAFLKTFARAFGVQTRINVCKPPQSEALPSRAHLACNQAATNAVSCWISGLICMYMRVVKPSAIVLYGLCPVQQSPRSSHRGLAGGACWCCSPSSGVSASPLGAVPAAAASIPFPSGNS